jgi:hypothetical protein
MEIQNDQFKRFEIRLDLTSSTDPDFNEILKSLPPDSFPKKHIMYAINENNTEYLDKLCCYGYKDHIIDNFYSWNAFPLNEKHIKLLLWFIENYDNELNDSEKLRWDHKKFRLDISKFLKLYYKCGINLMILRYIMYLFINYDYRLATNFYKREQNKSFYERIINKIKHFFLKNI